jgi:PEP-CTERM motif-containing protein
MLHGLNLTTGAAYHPEKNRRWRRCEGFFDVLVLLGEGTTSDLTANYSATISPGTAVPEPSTLLLLLAAAPLAFPSVRIRLKVLRKRELPGSLDSLILSK